ncbi:hypothetical protein J7T55_014514 [Diaporthe amygdali]|uniref:uncharacterized protein n=1 Tax=Phomopsis amygdali TaxID=1214568 RepID=UPI0022FEDDD9|nr:uncharacterized protein J7T55_014514 [Diaporthe amygdali]KAJ0118061.1 hypothetical protein J7T55_014514 [Diaporthe amygdali]
MHRLPPPLPVPVRDPRGLDHAEQAASSITTHHHHHNFTPMAFESSDPEATSLTSLSDILDNLPTAVKSSLGPLNTIRRSVSIRGWASYFYEISSNSMGAAASHHEGPAAAAHHTTVVSRTTSTTAVEMQHSNRGEKRAAAPAQAQRRMPEPPLYEVPDQNFGINRFCGLQGQLLVNNALSEGRPPSVQGQPGANRIDRKAYVQGVAWLVHGLPEDLDKHERTELIRAMPPALLEEAHRTPPSSQPAARPSYPSSSSTSPSSNYAYLMGGGVGDAGRTLVQRAARALVLQLLVPLHLLWAYVVVLLGRAVQLERKYKVTEQVVRHSGELGYEVGRGGVKLSGVIYNHGGARVGHLVTNMVAYTADGLVKGISDGIREARTERRQIAED